MKRWKLYAGITIVFVLGLLVGSLGTNLYYEQRVHRFLKGDPSKRKTRILEKISEDLQLTEHQKESIEGILDQLDARREEYFRKSRTELRDIIASGFSRIRMELNPDQQKKFDEVHEKLEKQRKKRPRFPRE